VAQLVREVRAIPQWLLRDYLVDLGGEAVDAATVRGDGWVARIVELPDHVVGSLRVGRLRIDVEAAQTVLDELAPVLDLKLVRAGG